MTPRSLSQNTKTVMLYSAIKCLYLAGWANLLLQKRSSNFKNAHFCGLSRQELVNMENLFFEEVVYCMTDILAVSLKKAADSSFFFKSH